MWTLIPRRPRNGAYLEPFRQEMDELFGRFFEPQEERALQAWAPRVDVEESDKALLVKVDLPGVDARQVSLDQERLVGLLDVHAGRPGLQGPLP